MLCDRPLFSLRRPATAWFSDIPKLDASVLRPGGEEALPKEAHGPAFHLMSLPSVKCSQLSITQ